MLSGSFSAPFFFPANTGKLHSTRYGARSRTIGAYRTNSDTEFATCRSKREAISDSPNGEAICRSFRTLIEHIGKESISANLNVKLRPFSFPPVFSRNSTGECRRITKRSKAR